MIASEHIVLRRWAKCGFGEHGPGSNTELSEFLALTELRGGNSVSFAQPIILSYVCKCELTEFVAELTEFAQKISEFSLTKHYSRNSIPPVSWIFSCHSEDDDPILFLNPLVMIIIIMMIWYDMI